MLDVSGAGSLIRNVSHTQTMLPRPIQTKLSCVLMLIGAILLTYAASTYSAWHRCDMRYGRLLSEVIFDPGFRECFVTRGQEEAYMRYRTFRPSGHMYSGWQEMGLTFFGGGALSLLGLLALLDTCRKRKGTVRQRTDV